MHHHHNHHAVVERCRRPAQSQPPYTTSSYRRRRDADSAADHNGNNDVDNVEDGDDDDEMLDAQSSGDDADDVSPCLSASSPSPPAPPPPPPPLSSTTYHHQVPAVYRVKSTTSSAGGVSGDGAAAAGCATTSATTATAASTATAACACCHFAAMAPNALTRHDHVGDSHLHSAAGGVAAGDATMHSGSFSGYDVRMRLFDDEDSACPALLEREFHSLHRNVPGLRRAGVDTNTIRQHFYPDGGWGWIVCGVAFLAHVLTIGFQLSYGLLLLFAIRHLGKEWQTEAGWLGATSWAVSMLATPVIIALCRRKSTRLTAVIGGLVLALGILFTSFATELHQVAFSYGVVVGVGASMVRDSSAVMLGLYFKRRRQFVEMITMSGEGVGVALFSVILKEGVGKTGWRLGLQMVTGLVACSFFMGLLYRPASLYHPQRRAILHLKNQRKKVKEKKTHIRTPKPPFLDFTPIHSATLRWLMLATAIAAFGIYTPIFSMSQHGHQHGFDVQDLVLLQTFLGLSMAFGVMASGSLINKVCHIRERKYNITRQHVCQASVTLVAVSTLAISVVTGYRSMCISAWGYGLGLGGYRYSLKMFALERIRAKRFTKAWGFIKSAESIPVLLGVPLTTYLNDASTQRFGRAGYYVCAAVAAISAILMFFVGYAPLGNETTAATGTGSGIDSNGGGGGGTRSGTQSAFAGSAAGRSGVGLAGKYQTHNGSIGSQHHRPGGAGNSMEGSSIVGGGVVAADCPDLLNRGFTAAGRYVNNWCSGGSGENGQHGGVSASAPFAVGGRPMNGGGGGGAASAQATTTAAASATAASSSGGAVCGSGGHRSQQQQQLCASGSGPGSYANGPWTGWAVGGGGWANGGGNNRSCGCRSTVGGTNHRYGGGPALGNGRLQKSLSFAFQNPAMWGGGDGGGDGDGGRAHHERRGTTASNQDGDVRWWTANGDGASSAGAYQYATYRPRSRCEHGSNGWLAAAAQHCDTDVGGGRLQRQNGRGHYPSRSRSVPEGLADPYMYYNNGHHQHQPHHHHHHHQHNGPQQQPSQHVTGNATHHQPHQSHQHHQLQSSAHCHQPRNQQQHKVQQQQQRPQQQHQHNNNVAACTCHWSTDSSGGANHQVDGGGGNWRNRWQSVSFRQPPVSEATTLLPSSSGAAAAAGGGLHRPPVHFVEQITTSV